MPKPKTKTIPIALLCALLSTGEAVHAGEIHIAVASNFRATMQELVAEFEQSSEHRVKMSFGSSGKIYAQINQGAPFHAFFSADQSKPLALEKSRLALLNSRFTYAIGSLVLWSSKPDLIDRELSRLHNGSFRKLAMANPKFAPYGVASLEVLETLGLKESTQPKWVLGENIAQTLQFVSTGNADMGFIALSQLRQKSDFEKGSWWLVPSEMHQPIYQDAVLLLPAKGNSAANELVTFMASDNAKKIMQSFGYSNQIEHRSTQ